MAPSPVKAALEDLLKARRLQADEPLLRGEERRPGALGCGIPVVDQLLRGGFPRGHVSEVQGSASSGRTAVALALMGRITAAGGLAAWVDPGDRLDPASGEQAGADLSRLLWLRGGRGDPRALPNALTAVGTLVGSGLFEVVVLDIAGLPPAQIRRLPLATWIRLQRAVEEQPTAVVLLADGHVAQGPGGASLLLQAEGVRWSGVPGPGRLLTALDTQVRAGRHAFRAAPLALHAPA